MYEWSIHRPDGYDAYDFYLYEYTKATGGYYITIEKTEEDELPTFKRNEIKKGGLAKPMFRITGPFLAAHRDTKFAITLVDWLCQTFRVKPSMITEQEGRAHGKLEATELHLHDMRHLVYARHLTDRDGKTIAVKPPLGERV